MESLKLSKPNFFSIISRITSLYSSLMSSHTILSSVFGTGTKTYKVDLPAGAKLGSVIQAF